MKGLLFFLGSRFGHLFVLMLGLTWRVTVRGRENTEQVTARKKPLVMITWHGKLLVPTWNFRKRNVVAMISRHRDGEMVARLVQRMGFDTVRGSSTRGGSAAAMQMLDRIRSGQIAAMICDGPRGPRHKMKPGAAFLAIQAGAEVIPATFGASSCWVFNSWDRFTVPKPFSKVTLLYGNPISPPEDTNSLKPFARTLETALNDLTAKAEEMVKK